MRPFNAGYREAGMPPYALTPRNIQLRDNFDAIAPKYDLTNRVISLGIDLHWRSGAIRHLADMRPGGVALDLACGTCDMALEVLRQKRAVRVVGADLSRAMLGLARKKLSGRSRGADARITLVNAPAEALPFRDGAFDAVTIAFGIRNVPDFKAGLKEVLRILKKGGRACILEFSTPPSKLWWKVYNYYFFNILPRIGGLITGREAADRFLTDSAAPVPGAPGVKAAMAGTGLPNVSYHPLNGGTVNGPTGNTP